MEKKVLLFSLLFVILILPFMVAENQIAVDNAYDCLKDQINTKTCDSLSTSEKIFSNLAINDCETELWNDSYNDECWPGGDCDIKTTSQAILSLGRFNTEDAKDWLLSKNSTPSEIAWFLQIDSTDVSTCIITYDSNEYSINIDEDKKINSDAGTCLSLTPSEYWLQISSTCYEEEFKISCDKDFITSLLFKKSDSSTVYVSEKTSSASPNGITTEKINSFCFTENDICDYEGSLWATLALSYLGEEIDSYVPYLITMAEENPEFIPESFLYSLTSYSEFQYDLISKQLSTGYWDVSGNKYYDTALALYPFMNTELNAKTNAKEALLENQAESGCWNSNNILETAFILYSIWPKGISPGPNPDDPDTELDCIEMGYSCMLMSSCIDIGGDYPDYPCDGWDICCGVAQTIDTCEVMGGKICEQGKECSEYTWDALDTSECCLDVCIEGDVPPSKETECSDAGGFCETGECGQGYESNLNYECDSFSEVCCFRDSSPSPDSKSKLWLWILLILIVLVSLGIFFRDKLREAWIRITSKKPKRPGSGFPFLPSSRPRRRIMPRRIMPSGSRPPPRPPAKAPSRSYDELDHVLKRLKNMSKK